MVLSAPPPPLNPPGVTLPYPSVSPNGSVYSHTTAAATVQLWNYYIMSKLVYFPLSGLWTHSPLQPMHGVAQYQAGELNHLSDCPNIFKRTASRE